MKRIILTSLIGLVTLASCSSEPTVDERAASFAELIDVPTTMKFEESSFDFGTIVDGEQVGTTFKFENSGDEDLVLISVKASCGCTVAEEWPKERIAPGDSGEIKIKFDSKGRAGVIRKTIKIEANTLPSVTILTLTGEVRPKL